MKRILSLFLAGLATLLPVYISIWLIVWLFNLVDNILKPLLEPIIGCAVPGLGFIIIIALVILLGFISTNYFGRRILRWWENILHNIPLGQSIWNYKTYYRFSILLNKRFQASSLGSFRPHFFPGLYYQRRIPHIEEDTYSIFIPTTPNPTSGWFVVLPREDVKILDMSVDQGMEFIISAGMVANGKSHLSSKGE